jgi:hypothetical protein
LLSPISAAAKHFARSASQQSVPARLRAARASKKSWPASRFARQTEQRASHGMIFSLARQAERLARVVEKLKPEAIFAVH